MKYSSKDIREMEREFRSCKDDVIDIDDGVICDDDCCYGGE